MNKITKWQFHSTSNKGICPPPHPKIKLHAVVQKCHCGNFSVKARVAVPSQYRPSKRTHRNSKILFVLDSYEFLSSKHGRQNQKVPYSFQVHSCKKAVWKEKDGFSTSSWCRTEIYVPFLEQLRVGQFGGLRTHLGPGRVLLPTKLDLNKMCQQMLSRLYTLSVHGFER